MKVVKATHLGMCFGVRDAIDLALKQTEPVTILGELVHNQTVLQRLRAQGVRMEHDLAAVQTTQVMITAHGTSQRALDSIRRRGLTAIEATCPLVHFAHRAVAKGARSMTLEVRMSNRPAQEMYRKFGFAPAGVRKGYYAEVNEDALVMWAHDIDQPAYAERLAAIEATLPEPTRIEGV